MGTTKFERLVEVTGSREFQEYVNTTFGTDLIIFQIGRGTTIPERSNHAVVVEWFRLRPDISEVLTQADLVITHCGAGSIMDALKAEKKVIAVVNGDLMNNHQSELAEAMVENGPYIFGVDSPDELIEKMRNFDFKILKPWKKPNLKLFADEILSFIKSD